jgi:hypothetical protein
MRAVELALAVPAAGCPLTGQGADGSGSTVSRFAQLMEALDAAFGATGYRYVRARFAELAATRCPGIEVVIGQRLPSPDEWWIGLVEEKRRIVVGTFTLTTDPIPVELAQLAERRVARVDHADRLLRMAAGKLDPAFKARLIRRVRQLRLPAAGLEQFFLRGDVELQTEAYLWQAQTDRPAALRAALQRLNDPTAVFVPGLLTMLVSQDEEKAEVVRRASREAADDGRKAALVALFGQRDDVVGVLSAPDPRLRDAGVAHLAYRDDVAAVAAAVVPRLVLPTSFQASLPDMQRHRDRVLAELAATPDWALGIRARLILDLEPGLPEGLKMWVEKEVRRRTHDLPIAERAGIESHVPSHDRNQRLRDVRLAG